MSDEAENTTVEAPPSEEVKSLDNAKTLEENKENEVVDPSSEEEWKKDGNVEDKKSEDKQEIEDEEREMMIEENKDEDKSKRVKGSEVEKKKKALEEAALEGPKRRVPIGGIKIPGFLRPKSREKTKEGGEADTEEGTDLLEAAVSADEKKQPEPANQSTLVRLGLNRINLSKISNPFARFTKDVNSGGGEESKPEKEEGVKKPSGARLLNAVKLPLASVLPKLRPTNQNKDLEGGGGPAGLASVETLDDVASHKIDENNMEDIKLDNHDYDIEKAAVEDEKPSKWANNDWRFYYRRFYEFRYPIVGLLVLFILLIIIIAVAVSGPKVLPPHAPIIDGKYITAITSCGLVEGTLKKGVFLFQGIPYVVPPVGALRWALPSPFQLADCWNSTLKVHNASAICWQFDRNNSAVGSEDCLTLDIVTPFVRYSSPVPVVVTVSLDSLSGPQNVKLPFEMARKKDIVFVNVNIRLGPFGFLPASALSSSTYPKSSGNYGLQDLISALRWVRLNIQHFGGDEKSVTVLAHRSAATLVTALTTSLKSEELFARAWVSSGSAVFPNQTLLQSERQSESYLASLKCGDRPTVECLRRQEAEDLMESVPSNWRRKSWDFLPVEGETRRHQWLVQDGLVIRKHPYDFWKDRNITTQLVIGTTQHSEWEGGEVLSEEQIIGLMKGSVLGNRGLVDEVIKRYNATHAGLQAAIADVRTVCPLYNIHLMIANSRFYVVNKTKENGLTDSRSDIDAILGQYNITNSGDHRYVKAIQSAFYQFVSDGVLPERRITYFDENPISIRELPNCDFWQEMNFTDFARTD